MKRIILGVFNLIINQLSILDEQTNRCFSFLSRSYTTILIPFFFILPLCPNFIFELFTVFVTHAAIIEDQLDSLGQMTFERCL